MSYSEGFKINVNKLNADEMVLVMCEITHPFLIDPVRIVNDSKNLISNGNEYISMSFEFVRQSDVKDELPKATISFPNVGREMVRWIDSSGGGRGSVIKMMLARRSSPDLIEESISFGIEQVKISTLRVDIVLIIQNNLSKRSMKYVYDLKRASSLF